MGIDSLMVSIMEGEGFSSKPYRCPSGKLTIGHGINLEDRGITLNESRYLVKNTVLNLNSELKLRLPFFKRLDDIRQNVLIEMAYNMGVNNLMKFSKTLGYIQKGEYVEASREMLDSKWHRDFILYAPNTPITELRSSKLSLLMAKGEY